MITRNEITAAGSFIKTHGIKGELSALLSVPVEFFDSNPMFICDMDGILVPFFIENIRPRGERSALIKPESVNNEEKAKLFVGKDIYVLKARLMEYEQLDIDEDEQGVYTDDLVGYTVVDDFAGLLGEIVDIEDSTANMLFILRTPADKTLYIPVAEPFIQSINPQSRTIKTILPDGLANLND